jgi:hypothetical protein
MGFRRFGQDFARRFAEPFGASGSMPLLPLSIDFSTKPDGTLPYPLSGSTWSIASGKAVNTPTLGTELLTDPGLEANYTAGLCDTLTKNGTPTLAQSADAHAGTKAQQFTAAAFNNRLNYPTFAGQAGVWYQYHIWTKRTAGSSGAIAPRLFQTGMLPASTLESRIVDAAYTKKVISGLSTTTNAIFCYPMVENGSSAFDTGLADDGGVAAITYSSLFAMLPSTQANVIAKIMPDVLVDDTHIGIIVGGDAQSSPANYIIVTARRHPNILTLLDVDIWKKAGSAYTLVAGGLSATIAANAWLEVRRSGSTVKVYYNNVQVGTDQTIADAAILAGTFHGFLSAGGNMIKQAFFQAN